MKIILKLTMLSALWLVTLAAFTPLVLAQSAGDTMPAAADDRLTFMQHEERSEPADSVGTGGIILKTFGAMLIIVGLIFFAAWGLKKFGYGPKASGGSDAPELSIVSTVTVGSGRTISTIKFGSRTLLVGSTPQSFTLLADGADDEFSAPGSVTGPRSVAELLAAEDSFAGELEKAGAGFGAWAEQGGQA